MKIKMLKSKLWSINYNAVSLNKNETYSAPEDMSYEEAKEILKAGYAEQVLSEVNKSSKVDKAIESSKENKAIESSKENKAIESSKENKAKLKKGKNVKG